MSTKAQEKPSLNSEPYTDVMHRQDVCGLHDNYYGGSKELRSALNGLKLHALVGNYNDVYFKLDENGAIDEQAPGFTAEILDALAERAGFTWRNSFGTYAKPGENHTYTDLLEWGTDHYDVVADWHNRDASRLKLGIGFPEGFVDASYIMIQKKSSNQKQKGGAVINWWSWKEPFSSDVWMSIALTIIVSAIFYTIFEFPTQPRKIGHSLFGMAMSFTQHVVSTPKSHAGKILVFGITSWSLILVSTYTANLASFFINVQPRLTIETIDDALTRGLSICVQEGYLSHEYMLRTYPQAKLVAKSGGKGDIRGLLAGDCVLALSSVNEWDEAKINKEFNGDCNLEWVGRVVHPVNAGFGVKIDSGKLCTSFIQNVLNMHLVDMKEDGTLEKIRKGIMQQQLSIDCTTAKATEDEKDDGTLSLEEMAGTFLIQAIAIIVAILTYLITYYSKKGGIGLSITTDDSNSFVADGSINIQKTAKLSMEQKLVDIASKQEEMKRDFASQQEGTRKAIEEVLARLTPVDEEGSSPKLRMAIANIYGNSYESC